LNNVSACVFSDMRYQLIDIGDRRRALVGHDVFHVMTDSLLYPPATNGEWGGWTAKDIADFERYNDQACEFDPT
jgi:hypothetical protein